MARETGVQSQVGSYQRLKKWYLILPCLTLSIIRYVSRVKWSNPGKGVAPSPTFQWRELSGSHRLWSPTLLNYIYELAVLWALYLDLAKNYRGITLTSIAAKIYNALLRNRIEPKIDNILRKNQNGFRRNRSTTSQILTIRRILEGVQAKNLQATLLFVDFTKAFDSIHRGKMEQILLAYGLPKETVAAIMILYRNTKVKVRSPDGDTEYFDIVAGVLQGDTLAPYLFIICLDYVLRTSIDKIRENGFELTKRRSKRYPAKTITDADYADDLALLANTPNQAETLLHSLERAAAGIGLRVNANKTEYMCYNQTGNIATLDGASLKLVDKFTYLGSSVSSNEKDIDTRLTKAWTAIDRLSIIWKSDLTDKMKRSFFQAAVVSILLYGCTTWTLTKRLERKLDGNYTRMLRAVLNKSWRQHPTRLQLYGHLPPHHENYTSQTNQTRGTLLEKQGRAHKRCTPVDPHIWMCKSRTTSTNLHTATMWRHRM